MASVFGGTQSLHTNAFDEALGELNTCHFPYMAEPLAHVATWHLLNSLVSIVTIDFLAISLLVASSRFVRVVPGSAWIFT